MTPHPACVAVVSAKAVTLLVPVWGALSRGPLTLLFDTDRWSSCAGALQLEPNSHCHGTAVIILAKPAGALHLLFANLATVCILSSLVL